MNMGQKPRRGDNGEVSGGGGVWTSDNHKGESMNSSIAALLISVSAFAASPALAGSISFKPLIDTRMRYENVDQDRSEEHTSELQSLMRISYAVFCLKKKNKKYYQKNQEHHNILRNKILNTNQKNQNKQTSNNTIQ